MEPVPVADLCAYLAGSWRVERTLVDRSSGSRGRFDGTVLFVPGDFEPDGGGLRQREHGTISWPTYTGKATREYLLQATTEPAALDIYFPAGRFFHTLNLSAGTWTTVHGCAPDTYTVTYHVVSARRLDYEWDVSGPDKNLLLTTSLFRPVG
ncbi:hypothetical protein IV500_09870 [Paeniglutamicibacter antarcticus]|uniref:DUF6314 domain-containing protein n=1 Tax=Arthrobacter terrae TaxID=2935737 RepID=A0A931G596_9MICC|nr:DUF6314 family protein [Arthrobacter terrae]MBG0739693.1 hypothetical protein [Arthrobacter terrae]